MALHGNARKGAPEKSDEQVSGAVHARYIELT